MLSRGGIAADPAPTRVLLVDDNQDAADMLAELLRVMGHDVTVAHDGPSALAAEWGMTPAVALLDIGLPLMDGYELARQLRSRHPQMRLVALTGYGQESDRIQSRNAGFDAHLVKPVDLPALNEVLTF
jgi:CheY-like chemotaxis protein